MIVGVRDAEEWEGLMTSSARKSATASARRTGPSPSNSENATAQEEQDKPYSAGSASLQPNHNANDVPTRPLLSRRYCMKKMERRQAFRRDHESPLRRPGFEREMILDGRG